MVVNLNPVEAALVLVALDYWLYSAGLGEVPTVSEADSMRDLFERLKQDLGSTPVQ